jgi:hydrogenase maturation factor
VILLTKGVPIEATALLAREFPERLAGVLGPEEMAAARNFLRDPGISVVRDARLALGAGRVTAMHDPTEGGLLGALWELADASGHAIRFDAASVPVPPLAAKVCSAFGIDPLASIASGALLITTPADHAAAIRGGLRAEGIECSTIGSMEAGPPSVWLAQPSGTVAALRPMRDEIARVFGTRVD